jgi:hypothetical protein
MGTKSSVPRRAGKSDKLALDDASSTRRRHKKSSPQRSRQRSQSEISADIKDAVAFAKAANEFSERYPGGVPVATLTPDVRDRVCRCREWVLQDLRAKGQLPPDRIEPVVDDLVGAAWYLHTLQPTRPQEIQEASAGVAVGVTEFQFEPTALVDLNDKRVPTRRPRSPPAGAAGRFPAPARGSPVRCGAGYQPATGARLPCPRRHAERSRPAPVAPEPRRDFRVGRIRLDQLEREGEGALSSRAILCTSVEDFAKMNGDGAFNRTPTSPTDVATA